MENIIFDLGGVLVSHDPGPYLERLFSDPKDRQRVLEILSEKDFWTNLDLGLHETYKDALPEIYGKHKKDENLLRRFFDSDFMDEYTSLKKGTELLSSFKKQGYGIYILSNFSKDGIKKLMDSFSFFDDADGMLISCDVHLVKPDKRIYRLLEEKFDLFADECLFLDDREENVLAARNAGFNSIVYSEDTIDEELKKYL